MQDRKYSEMTVAELRAEMKKRGLPQQEKGKKFTKPELISKLEENDKEIKKEVKKEEAKEPASEKKSAEVVLVEKDEDQFSRMAFDELRAEMWARKLSIRDEAVKVYSVQEMRKKLREYEETKEARQEEKPQITFRYLVEKYIEKGSRQFLDSLPIGDYVAFIHHVESKNGEVYKRLRTAMVTNINRKKRLVKLETLGGTQVIAPFDDILCAKGVRKKFPYDIRVFRKSKRTRSGENFLKGVFEDGTK